MSNVYNIPAGPPFAKSLAAELLRAHKDSPESLADILILLPTRRACRTLREAFLQLNAGVPILLPRMQPLGDIDEEELALSVAGQDATQDFLSLPPAMPPMRRQILLARAIAARPDFAPNQSSNFDQALALAKTLGALMDQIYTENLDMKDLAALVPEEFASHWQITLDFLKILSEEWPQILDTLGMIDAADRRNRLIQSLTAFWDARPPQTRIIAAGTTGSIPATARLLRVIANLPNGEIILPGLDPYIDDESWETLSENHPQFGFKQLLSTLDIPRSNVKDWPIQNQDPISAARRALISEVMRPAETTKKWQSLHQNAATFSPALDTLKYYDCENGHQEAQTIAILMRSILEKPEQTAVLITPDRNLAKRVTIALRRWNITIDDSAGTPLSQSKTGQFLTLSAQACAQNIAPVALLALLKHPLCALNDHISAFEDYLLRGIKPPAGFDGLRIRLKEFEAENKKDIPEISALVDTLETALAPLYDLHQSNTPIQFNDALRAHIKICENLSATEFSHQADTQDDTQDGAQSDLWRGEDGQNIAAFLSDLLNHAALFPPIHAKDYAAILQQFLNAQTTRPAYGTHPRLQILGQLEARLIDADLVILGGLNEGSWPPDSGHDPWMSRPMRKNFGLPSAERGIGLAAHDFAQGFCAPNVAMTRAAKTDSAPTVPARWLSRLETVMQAAQISTDHLNDEVFKHWIKALDHTDETISLTRPAPTPPQSARPRRVSVTKIETWIKDPYSLYAYYVLSLRKLRPLEQQADNAIRGQILHTTLENFITAHPKNIPNDAQHILENLAHNALEAHHIEPQDWEFYWGRFANITQSYLEKEEKWRKNAAPLACEVKGEMTFQTSHETSSESFILHGYADRIDTLDNGDAAIIDYKSGGQFSKTAIKNGSTPQLPLEALIVQHGGFENIPPKSCGYLGYWTLNASNKHTEITNIDDILIETEDALTTLIETFQNDDTPYYSLPRADALPRFNDYEHLARVKEWAAMDESEDAA